MPPAPPVFRLLSLLHSVMLFRLFFVGFLLPPELVGLEEHLVDQDRQEEQFGDGFDDGGPDSLR